MLSLSLWFFILAIAAAIFGFTGIALAVAGIAKILFFLFLILFVVSLLSRVADTADREINRHL